MLACLSRISQPVVGLSSSSVVSEQTAVEEGSRYTLQDKQVSLENVSSDLPSVKKPTLQGVACVYVTVCLHYLLCSCVCL